MNIALMANDRKKELMVQFCIAYCGILSKHQVFATAATGKMVADVTGLKVYLFLSGKSGGAEQVASKVACDEIDLVLYFRDPALQQMSDAEQTLLRLCDMHNVPIATNIATAEVLVCALDRGDLSWREVYHLPQQKDVTRLF